jgi:glycine/serine hydroxymethyltransferase
MNEGDMKQIASLIARAVRDTDGAEAAGIAAEVADLVTGKPAYPTV